MIFANLLTIRSEILVSFTQLLLVFDSDGDKDLVLLVKPELSVLGEPQSLYLVSDCCLLGTIGELGME